MEHQIGLSHTVVITEVKEISAVLTEPIIFIAAWMEPTTHGIYKNFKSQKRETYPIGSLKKIISSPC